MPSTLIRNSRYDPQSQTLSVWFVTNGKRYDYQNVPPETYGAFRNAFSKGRFFNREIRGNYEFRQVDDENEDAPRNYERKS
jgi:hypothetical protein